MSRNEHYGLAVIGGGSGGMACALAAARQGIETLLVERGPMLGGTATCGGVNCWEMGVGGTGIPFDLYKRLKHDRPDAIGIYSIGRHFCWQDAWYWPNQLDKVNFPGGELLIDPRQRYLDTLRRHPDMGEKATESFCREHWHGIPFLPDVMADMFQAVLRETGHANIRIGATFTEISATEGRVRSVRLDDGSVVTADAWVDGCGGEFCRACGCDTLLGFDSRSRFHESMAHLKSEKTVNGVTLIYRVSPTDNPRIEPLPSDIPCECWWDKNFPAMSCVQYPDRSRNCNMLPTMKGAEFIALGASRAYAECGRRVRAHWRFVQTHWPEFQNYRMTWIASLLGIREQYRVVCEKMLTMNDIQSGIRRQSDPDIVTLVDHALDCHGEGGGCIEMPEPYGVPYRCLIPKGWRNLLVACRAAGFSSIVASSCRLTRTMMQLGQAAGTAVVLAQRNGVDLPDVAPDALRQALRAQHVQLEWPLSTELRDYLAEERLQIP